MKVAVSHLASFNIRILFEINQETFDIHIALSQEYIPLVSKSISVFVCILCYFPCVLLLSSYLPSN